MKNARAGDQIEWRCSQSYTSSAYAQLMCPYRRSTCGPNKVINFYTDQDDGAVHVIGLKKGESCVYNIESVCGGPSFNIKNSSDVEVFFAEWQQDSVSMVTPVSNKPFKSEELSISSPQQDYPTRNVDFIKQSDATEPGPVYGVYKKDDNGQATGDGEDIWNYWQNQETSSTDAAKKTKEDVARRYDKSDNNCKLRNILLTVLAKTDDA